MALDEEMERRLIYAKYLFLHGQEHAKENTAPSRMIAVHNFDNTVEWVLKCIATKQRLTPDKKYFYFPELLEKIKGIPYIEDIKGLHELRNNVQHQSNIPSPEDITRYSKCAEDFLKEAVNKYFNKDFSELSLASLIEDNDVKSHIAEAEKKLEEEDYENSIKFSSKAFYLSAIRLKKNINEMLDRGYDIQFLNYSDFEELDIPYLDFAKFLSITTWLNEFPDKSKQEDLSVIDKWNKDLIKSTKDNTRYCFNFALKYILKWQSFWKNEV